jgi:hypothetical protein
MATLVDLLGMPEYYRVEGDPPLVDEMHFPSGQVQVGCRHAKHFAPVLSLLAVEARDAYPKLAFAQANREHRLDPTGSVV